MPAGIVLPHFDGTKWNEWFGILEALLMLHKAEDVYLHYDHPLGSDKKEWDGIQRCTKAYLCLYTTPDVYSLIEDEIEYPSFKHNVCTDHPLFV